MRVKAIDIAKELGISKATVSLALNDKPGVSERTRQEVKKCYMRLQTLMETNRDIPELQAHKKMIYVIIPNRRRQTIQNPEIDLWTEVNATFDQMAKKEGYTLGISFPDTKEAEIESVISTCNSELIAGVILFSTELYPEDLKIFEGINKPMVIYDSDLRSSKYSQVLLNNRQGVKLAVDHLALRGHRDIRYMATTIDIYNHIERRRGFLDSLYNHGFPSEKSRIITMGNSIEMIYKNMVTYIKNNRLPSALIMESYHVSIGVVRALRENDVSIPDQISLIGIDSIPSFMTGNCELSTIRIPHTERAVWGMVMLFQEISHYSETKSNLLTNCSFHEGSSVKIL